MPVPVIVVGALAASGTSVVVGAGINKLTGTKNTSKTVVLDAILGATPLAAIKGLANAGRIGIKYRKYVPAGTKVFQKFGRYTHNFSGGITSIATKKEYYIGLGVTLAVASKPAWMSFIKKQYITAVVDTVFDMNKKKESPSRSLTSRRKGGTSSRYPNGQKKQVGRRTTGGADSKSSRSRGKTYCKRHKQYDFCKKYNIS